MTSLNDARINMKDKRKAKKLGYIQKPILEETIEQVDIAQEAIEETSEKPKKKKSKKEVV